MDTLLAICGRILSVMNSKVCYLRPLTLQSPLVVHVPVGPPGPDPALFAPPENVGFINNFIFCSLC